MKQQSKVSQLKAKQRSYRDLDRGGRARGSAIGAVEQAHLKRTSTAVPTRLSTGQSANGVNWGGHSQPVAAARRVQSRDKQREQSAVMTAGASSIASSGASEPGGGNQPVPLGVAGSARSLASGASVPNSTGSGKPPPGPSRLGPRHRPPLQRNMSQKQVRLLHGVTSGGGNHDSTSEQAAEEEMLHLESRTLKQQMRGIEDGVDAIFPVEDEHGDTGEDDSEELLEDDSDFEEEDHFEHVLNLFDLEHPDMCRRARQRTVTWLAVSCGCISQKEIDAIDDAMDDEGGDSGNMESKEMDSGLILEEQSSWFSCACCCSKTSRATSGSG